MHPEILRFWKDNGYDIFCQENPSVSWTNVPAYFYLDEQGAQIAIACPFLPPSGIAYFMRSSWYAEDYMLKLIKLKAFL